MTIKRVFFALAFIVIALVAVLVIKMVSYPFQPTKKLKDHAKVYPYNGKAINRLAQAIRIPTISNVNYENTDFKPFNDFKSFLINSYPAIYKQMDTLTINKHGLVFKWKGKDATKKPILFLSHQDVVPISDYNFELDPTTGDRVFNLTNTETDSITEYQSEWKYPPFSGAVANGRIYGRGTLDMKGMLIAIMEAADELIAENYQPEQDVYFAFGQDEEVSGLNGAKKIAEYFKEQNIHFDAVYDEGGFVLGPKTVLKAVDKAVATVGVGEKGFLTVAIRVNGTGGHSSIPPKKGSLVLAAELAEKLNTNQLPATIIPPVANFINNIGGAMDFKSKLAISNQWLLGGVLLKTLENTPASNAMVRTTTALTMMHASDAPNVLSATTTLTVNFRILQGQTVADVLEHVKKQCEGYDTEIDIISQREPSNLSPTDSKQYLFLKDVIAKNYPNAIITPYLTIGGTDSYKYELVSDNVFRFMPVQINEYEQRLIHNDNESISIENYMRMINHFKLLMQQP
ncbi:M20/M25/M40 family metallo-hydrolase [Flavobacterium agricola]|uniref:M20/M25/M40 family metallo-hydrolase n=1 Tax=Flavobacterium agricola TaxID=2870839 RepID=A0ABY6M0Y3_9FLAO|nr:M20/M25/M40 family metallo-hydrolase [Flavobacterium agricola]UYW02208.1 M20/M25/M40 family metallo-hydrolase [Flavobacterium agricola]